MSILRNSLFCTVALLALAACGDVREDLGMGRNPPDEFAVMERPPLSLPPDYGLRPPRPGALPPQTVNPAAEASAAVFNGNPETPANAPSPGEQALLSATGATKTDSSIRDAVDREEAQKVVASPHLMQNIMDWGDDKKPSPTVDPAAEAARLKQDQAAGQPVTTGATPIIEKQSSGWLGL